MNDKQVAPAAQDPVKNEQVNQARAKVNAYIEQLRNQKVVIAGVGLGYTVLRRSGDVWIRKSDLMELLLKSELATTSPPGAQALQMLRERIDDLK